MLLTTADDVTQMYHHIGPFPWSQVMKTDYILMKFTIKQLIHQKQM